jgi:hypothetical protein
VFEVRPEHPVSFPGAGELTHDALAATRAYLARVTVQHITGFIQALAHDNGQVGFEGGCFHACGQFLVRGVVRIFVSTSSTVARHFGNSALSQPLR